MCFVNVMTCMQMFVQTASEWVLMQGAIAKGFPIYLLNLLSGVYLKNDSRPSNSNLMNYMTIRLPEWFFTRRILIHI